MAVEDCVLALTKLGFNGLEAEIYAFLVQESPATGYRIAQALCRPAANVYKAIEALESKGAILIDQGTNRVCRAIPVEELLGQIDRAFQQKRSQAAEALASLRGAEEDDRVYQLKSRDQALERCRSMLARCRRLVLLDIFPEPLEALRPDIEAAAKRGIQVIIKGYLPVELEGAQVILNPNGTETMARYPGQWIILLTDGAELLLASLDNNQKDLHQAIWSGSVALSWIFHCSLAAEIMMATLLYHIDSGATLEQLRESIAPWMRENTSYRPEHSAVETALAPFRGLHGRGIPGYEMLLERFGNRDTLSANTRSDL